MPCRAPGTTWIAFRLHLIRQSEAMERIGSPDRISFDFAPPVAPDRVSIKTRIDCVTERRKRRTGTVHRR